MTTVQIRRDGGATITSEREVGATELEQLRAMWGPDLIEIVEEDPVKPSQDLPLPEQPEEIEVKPTKRGGGK